MLRGRQARILKTFGIKLKQARLRAGYKSAQKFAEGIGMEPAAYRYYERGKSEPSFETLTRICQSLDITPNDLLPEAATRLRTVLTA